MDYNIGQIIAALRKSKSITQEELARQLSISSQAVSKWETGTCLPDTQMLPALASFFGVSVDYLFNGDSAVKDKNIGDAIFDYISSFGQFKGYKPALELFNWIHLGLGGCSKEFLDTRQNVSHISDEHGLSLFGYREGYGVIAERGMFERVSPETLEFAAPVLAALADADRARAMMAVISMDSVAFAELAEMTGFDENKLRAVLDTLIENQIIFEEISKHKRLGTIYHVNSMLHTGICVLLATLEMMRITVRDGISCCMGYGDYPVRLAKEESANYSHPTLK